MPLSTPLSAHDRRRAFADTITFESFVGAAANFTAELRENYAATRLSEHDLRLLHQIGEPIDVLAIVEDARPDAVATLSILARIEQETGKVRLHILLPDESARGVVGAHPHERGGPAPTYVFTDRAGTELGIIAPPTAPVRERVRTYLDAFFAARSSRDHAALAARPNAEGKAELLAGALQLRRELLDIERSSFVVAIGELAVRSDS
jgi:hypothetical protein